MNSAILDRVFAAMKRACGRELCLEAFVVEYGDEAPGPLARCRTCGRRWAVSETGIREFPATVATVSSPPPRSDGA